MSISIIILLFLAGLLVGLINTFAGAAAAISISLLTSLGLPITVANGTNRIPVLMQTAVMSIGFRKQGFLDVKTGLKLGIPTIIGAVIGAIFASHVPPTVFQIMLGTILIALLAVLIMDPQRFLKTEISVVHKLTTATYIWFFIIGLYGGFFHIGVGYLILTVAILSLGYNLMEANALKGFVVMLYIPFTLVVFMLHDQVDYTYGLIHGCGNVVGAWFATRNAKRVPMNLIRWVLVVMIVVTIMDMFKIISIASALNYVFNNLLTI